jgi:hypothetical protein
MKLVMYALGLALLILLSAAGAVVGLGLMIYSLLTDKTSFLQAFEVFSLSSILFLVCIASYMIAKILTNTEVLSQVMAKFIQNEMTKSINPLAGLFGGMGLGMPKIITLDESQFSSPEEFHKHRDEILGKVFGNKAKNLNDLTIDELKLEEKKAVDNQDFELAAAIISLIEEKKKGSK